MRCRTKTAIGTITFAAGIVAMTCGGMVSGLRRDWPRMGLCFFLVVYIAQCCVDLVLNHKIESRFVRLAELVTGKSESDRLLGKFVPYSAITLTLISFAVMVFLSAFACNRGRWLVLCVFLAVFLIGNTVFTALVVWLKVKACSKRLEELIPRNREGEAHTEPGKL